MSRHLQVLLHAWRHRKQMDSESRRRHELEFLPAALEVQETPPSPASRMIAFTVILFFVLALIWAFIGQIDIVAVAQGKIIPAGKSKVIQPLEIGVVKAIHVEEDQRVKRGDPLLDLDSTMAQADEERLTTELVTARASLARTAALLKALDARKGMAGLSYTAPEGIAPEIARTQEALMRNQYSEYLSRVATLETEIRRARAESKAIAEDLKKVEAIIPLISRRVDNLQTLAGEQLISEHQYLELEEERIEHVQNRAVLANKLDETTEAIRRAEAEKNTIQAEFRKTVVSEQADLEIKIASLGKEVLKAQTRTGLQRLTAPVDGIVQQLAVNTIGGVVTPAQELMIIVPEEANLEVEALIANKDIGFVAEGQQAEIKIDAFPFTKYGTIDGKVLKISNDAIEHEMLGWVFSTRVLMEKSSLLVNGKDVNLSPGMSVSVELKTGKRHIIEYFLSPVLKGLDESVRER